MSKQKAVKKEVPNKMARKGGKATLKKYGKKHFSKLAKKRWAKHGAKKKK